MSIIHTLSLLCVGILLNSFENTNTEEEDGFEAGNKKKMGTIALSVCAVSALIGGDIFIGILPDMSRTVAGAIGGAVGVTVSSAIITLVVFLKRKLIGKPWDN